MKFKYANAILFVVELSLPDNELPESKWQIEK